MTTKIIVLGNDHTNSTGVVQSLGLEGYYVIAFVWGVKTGLVHSSSYLKELYFEIDAQACVDKMLKLFSNEEKLIPVIACCDTAALILEKNSNRLKGKFLFEYVGNNYTLAKLQEKNLQIKLAEKSGFNVPESVELVNIDELNSRLSFEGPFLIKPLMSIEGAKKDILICRDICELQNKATEVLSHTPRILIQQYIDKDYELSILGCAMKNGDVFIPAKEIKLSLFPPKTGLESKSLMDELTETPLIDAITTIIREINYVGLFSVELMHNPINDKLYFTEINLRNDGAQPFIRKYGYNLPTIHVYDLLDLNAPIKTPIKTHKGLYLWEMHHFESFRNHSISFWVWLSEILNCKGFLLTCKNDNYPFFKQFKNRLSRFLRRS